MTVHPARCRVSQEPAQFQYERIIRTDIRERFEGMDAASQVATATPIARFGIRPAALDGSYSPGESGACPLGWMPIFERTLRRLVKLGWSRELVQVRQKGGELRVVVDKAPTPLRTIVVTCAPSLGRPSAAGC